MSISRNNLFHATAIIIAVVVSLFNTGNAISAGDGRTHVVEIRNLQFIPAEITVDIGDTIKWINQDIVPHTGTADDKSWDSMLIGSGKEWELIVGKGSFTSYFCIYHPGMKAKIRINASM